MKKVKKILAYIVMFIGMLLVTAGLPNEWSSIAQMIWIALFIGFVVIDWMDE